LKSFLLLYNDFKNRTPFLYLKNKLEAGSPQACKLHHYFRGMWSLGYKFFRLGAILLPGPLRYFCWACGGQDNTPSLTMGHWLPHNNNSKDNFNDQLFIILKIIWWFLLW